MRSAHTCRGSAPTWSNAARIAQPAGHQVGAEVVEADEVGVLGPPHRQGPVGKVRHGRAEPGDLHGGPSSWSRTPATVAGRT
ncbi:hypothetical protein [Streptomyces phaeochromogenes]|uniref:hypothetical protein n=1 Tax=Streptomyces phaeochromogenes TaxID=1923 RepID=UPI0012FF4FA0|nr:hypothetical protein [Streptomyces phaeochromogenes]